MPLTNDEIRLRVIRLGRDYSLAVTVTDWSKTFLGSVQGWCVSLRLGPGREASAILKRGCGHYAVFPAEYVEFAWGVEAFPAEFRFDDFETVVQRAARSLGHTFRRLELVR